MLTGQKTQRGESLTFPQVTRHQAGLYTCSADNGSGKQATAKVQSQYQERRRRNYIDIVKMHWMSL